MRDTDIPPTRRLSRPELAFLRAIQDFIKKNGSSPTYNEVEAAMGRARGTTQRTIERLIKKGMLYRNPRPQRNLTLTTDGLVAAADGRRKTRI